MQAAKLRLPSCQTNASFLIVLRGFYSLLYVMP